jgi:hypothetical protein
MQLQVPLQCEAIISSSRDGCQVGGGRMRLASMTGWCIIAGYPELINIHYRSILIIIECNYREIVAAVFSAACK